MRVDRPALLNLLAYLGSVPDCDSTFTLTWKWAVSRELDPNAVVELLQSRCFACDREVQTNLRPEVAIELR